jgi:hypothetical protein
MFSIRVPRARVFLAVYHRALIPVIALSRRAMALVSSSSLRSILTRRKPATAMEKAPSAKFINVSSIFIFPLSRVAPKKGRAFTPAHPFASA